MQQISGFTFWAAGGRVPGDARRRAPGLCGRANAAGLPKSAAEEIARFNEVFDQTLAESVERCAADAAESRALFLAVLGHDVRSPLLTVRVGVPQARF